MNYTSKFNKPKSKSKQKILTPPKETQQLQQDKPINDPQKQKSQHQLRPPISYFQKSIRQEQGIRQSPQKPFNKMSLLLGNIVKKHQQMKQKLEHLKQEQQNKENSQILQYTFEPKLRPNPRYRINSNMQERTKSWDEARLHHKTSLLQENIQKEVQECTFSPRIVSKPKSRMYLKQKQLKGQAVRSRQNDEINKLQNKFIKMRQRELNANFTSQAAKPSIDINSIKSMIKSEINRIVFTF